MFHFSVTGHAADGEVGDICLQDVMVMWVLCLLLAVVLVVRLFNKVSKGKVPALPEAEVQFKDLFSFLFSFFFQTHTHTCVCARTHTKKQLCLSSSHSSKIILSPTDVFN